MMILNNIVKENNIAKYLTERTAMRNRNLFKNKN